MSFDTGLSMRGLVVGAVLCVLAASTSLAQTQEPAAPVPPTEAGLSIPAGTADDTSGDTECPEEDPKGWQIFFAAANLWPRLEESEDKVDHLLNNGLGRLFPRWEEPVTFKDWRDDFKLWDFQIGAAREINDKWLWYVSAGGTMGKQQNSKTYPFLLRPLKVDVDFERTVLLLSTGVDYYFNGQPSLPEGSAGMNGFWRRLKASKPYIEFATGYVDLKGQCIGTLERPVLGRLFRYTDKARYDLFYVSPRLGLDIPLTEKDNLSVQAGPIFFTSHNREFDNVSIYAIVRHRF